MHRDTILTPAIGFALLALTAIGAGSTLSTAATAQATPPAQTKAPPSAQAPASPPPQATPPNSGPQPPSAAAAQPQGSGAQGQGSRPAGASQAVGTAGGRGAAQVGRPRRRSYAACNRISHTRGLRGGARRRFLVRCKLGYDRPRNGQPQSTRQP
ncbi:MAG: hypothetical protein EOO66_28205 [Methylobacterium sp.]|nr:MAG: hypothetical protein EOO66_28205 [Methylobacterium sp.]